MSSHLCHLNHWAQLCHHWQAREGHPAQDAAQGGLKENDRVAKLVDVRQNIHTCRLHRAARVPVSEGEKQKHLV